jgi:hypothetical protein
MGFRHGFRLEESRSCALDFVHQGPTFDARREAHHAGSPRGAGVSVTDFDRDGWQDLYATNSGVGSRNALYRNRGDGTSSMWRPIWAWRTSTAPARVRWAPQGDFDNDGFRTPSL